MMNIAQNIRQAEVVFPVMESLIKQCLVVEVGERVKSVTSLMRHPVLWSLVEQLKNRIKPENLIFGLNRLETKDVIKDYLIEEMQKKLEETQKKMVDFMEKAHSEIIKLKTENMEKMATAQQSLEEAKKEISKLKTENEELNEKVGFLFASPLEGFGF